MDFGKKIAVGFFTASAVIGMVILLFNPFQRPFTASHFHPFENYKSDSSEFQADLTDAVYNGIIIPTVRQVPGGKFVFSFKVKNNKVGSRKLAYKIYYQNETYKHREFDIINGIQYENPASADNFYGSWEDTGIEFKEMPELGWFEEISIKDSFRIVGNPRNEQKYFGQDDSKGVSAADISGMIGFIRNDPAWYNSIIDKAKKANITLEEQLYRDALYQLNEARQYGDVNNRWKRNPRMGSYRFMVVVMDAGAVETLPVSVRKISEKERDGTFMNPFYYFLHGPGSKDKNTEVIVAAEELKVKASFDPASGVYINPFDFKDNTIDTAAYCETCGTDKALYRKAQFSQFFHHIDKNLVLPTIPVTADIVKDEYTREDYKLNGMRYSEEERIKSSFNISSKPCATVWSDKLSKAIILQNPGNAAPPYRKEHAGVKTRIGTTYGKYRVCVQFPKMLSRDHVWNGLVNAVWLLYQDNAAWNARGSCSTGYIPKDDHRGPNAERKYVQNYSEIDIEIMKCSGNWPSSSYGKLPVPGDDHPESNHNVVVACTNWDLACRSNEKNVAGVMPYMVNKRRFDLHRWDAWYQALTIRTPEAHDEIYNRDYYWYEIEWTPDHIAWSIGPEKEKMKLIGYMDRTVTTIPDNQMIVVVTQEFHDSRWWSPAPFDQRNIPFPKNPITGKVLAVEIE